MLFFEGSGKPDGPYKNLSEQINDKLSPHMVSTLGLELRLHWRETNALSPLHHLCPLSPVYPIDKDRYGGERNAREVNVKWERELKYMNIRVTFFSKYKEQIVKSEKKSFSQESVLY